MIELYCDESRQDLFYNKRAITDNNKFIFIGGIMLDRNERLNIKQQINDLKKEYDIKSELKWNRVTESCLELYKRMIDIYIDNNISFRSICIDSNKVNIKKYHEDNPELGFYKFYYQLLNNWLKADKKYTIYTDIKTYSNPDVLTDLKRCLNKSKHIDVVDNIYAIDSNESVFLQLEDILMGATSYKMNYGNTGKSFAKNELIKYMEEKLNKNLEPTGPSAVKFNLFEIRFRNE